MKDSKNVLTSITIWGVLLALSEVVVSSGDLVNGLFGVEWGGRAVIIAGLVVAVIGRLRASKTVTFGLGSGAALLAVAVLPAFVVVGGGCAGTQAGDAARGGVLSPWAQAAWPMIEDNARRGIDAKVEAGELTNAPDGGTAGFQRDTVDLFGEAVGALGGGS